MPKVQEKVIHPKSRKAKAANRKFMRDMKMSRMAKTKHDHLEIKAEKFLWFQNQINDNIVAYSEEDCHHMLDRYMERFTDELEQIAIVNSIGKRHGTQHSSRKNAINERLQQDKQDYDGFGFEIPDLTDKRTLKFFKTWCGEVRYLQGIKTIRLKSSNRPDTKEGVEGGGMEGAEEEWEDCSDEVDSDDE